MPPPRGHEVEKAAVQAAWKAKELVREKTKVELRGAQRLEVARERHKAFRARQLKALPLAFHSLIKIIIPGIYIYIVSLSL